MDEPRVCHIRQPNVGAITAMFFYREEEKCLSVGFSFCSPYDQFNRRLGRLIALNRLENRAVLIEHVTLAKNGKLDVVGTILNYLDNSLCKRDHVTTAFGVKPYNGGDGLFQSWLDILVLRAIKEWETTKELQKCAERD